MAKPLQAKLLLGHTIAIVTANAPGQHMWLSDLSLGPSAPNHWKQDVHVMSQKTVSARQSLTKFKRKESAAL